jgi:membrane-associated protein
LSGPVPWLLVDIHALTEQLALNPLDPKDLLSAFGLPGVLAILFAETGLLVGFFFPGDSLLFLAGVAASEVANSIFGEGAQISIVGLLIGAPICAIIGAQFGHWLGAKYGRRMFDKPDSKLFKKEYVEKAEYYFEKFGPAKAVVLARFIPIVRTFLNPVAGTLGMPAKQFFIWNVVGAILWTDGIILIGYLLAEQIYAAIGDKIDRYILPVVVLIVLVSVLPILIEILRERKAKKHGLKTAEPATAIGVVAAASVAGLADAAREEYHEHFDHDHHQQQHQHQQAAPQQPAYPQQGYQPTPQAYPPQQPVYPPQQQQYPPQQYGSPPAYDDQQWPRS